MKWSSETIPIPREFYSWIRGPYNETLRELATNAPNVKINIPPPSSKNETIIVTGDADQVEYVTSRLWAIYAEKKTAVTTISCSVPKALHRFIIGVRRSGIDEILRETDVTVELPPKEEESDVCTLRGPTARLGDALALVYSKASHNRFLVGPKEATTQSKDTMLQIKWSSETIPIPREYYPWIRGPFNETLNAIATSAPDVKINIPPPSSKNETIIVTGDPDQVEYVTSRLWAIYAEKKTAMATLSCSVPKALHRFIIGVRRSGIDEILRETDVTVELPPKEEESDVCTLRGPTARLGDALALVYSKAIHNEVKRRFSNGSKEAISQPKDTMPQHKDIILPTKEATPQPIEVVPLPPKEATPQPNCVESHFFKLDAEQFPVVGATMMAGGGGASQLAGAWAQRR